MFYFNIQIGSRNKSFTYMYDEDISLGTYCEVPFMKKTLKGIVVGKVKEDTFDFEIKKIIKVYEEKLDSKLFELIRWMHKYYLEPYGSLIKLIEKPDGKLPKKEKKEKIIESEAYKLTNEQENVVKNIEDSTNLIHLIKGVTGSGKTQIYIELINKALEEGKSSILLVPEISITTQLKNKLISKFGNNIAIWHSKLSKNDKLNYYDKIEKGEIKIVLGARSAIFANLKNLKYIILDEEHENTYKQDESPRYHTKNVAIKRAILENAKVILGSATPSFDTMYQVKNNNIQMHELNTRYNNASLPEYELVDINNKKIINMELIKSINEKLEKDEQVIILLNRKAYAQYIKCDDCNNSLECTQCSSALIYYNKKNILKCNKCLKEYKIKLNCPSCNSKKLIKLGMGTEKVEDELNEIFDENKILRMDSDTMTTNKKLEEAYNKFLKKEYNILVGTQILAKGFHFPSVSLVCVLNADQMLSYPDYRMEEKTFQLITQAAGRAGREKIQGKVIIQTYDINSALIDSIINNDYNKVYENQISLREKLFLPPISKHIKIHINDTNENRLDNKANEIYELLLNNLKDIAIVYPSSKALVYKIAKRYRKNINIVYDRKEEKKVKRIIRSILNNIKLSVTRVLVDVDPISMI